MNKIISIASLIIGLALPVGAEAPADIQVNGLINLFGVKSVMLRMDSSPQDLMLTEGESRDGVKLLEVDLKNGVARFDNHGKIQWVRISSAPDMPVAAETNPGGKRAALPALSGSGYSPAKAMSLPDTGEAVIANGADGYRVLRNGQSPPASNPSSPQPDNANTPDNSWNNDAAAASSGSSAKTTGVNQLDSWDYSNAKVIEAARKRDSVSILAGLQDPYPLTPLTPPGTAAQLISDQKLYFPKNPRWNQAASR